MAWDPIRDREYLEAGRRQVAGGRSWRQELAAGGRTAEITVEDGDGHGDGSVWDGVYRPSPRGSMPRRC